MRLGVTVVLGSLALAASAQAHNVPYFWTVGKVMGTVDGTRLRVGGSVVRINAESTLCSGEGRVQRRKGVRRWRHFLCTYTHITPRGIGRDVDFRVHVLGVRRFVITDARWVRDAT